MRCGKFTQPKTHSSKLHIAFKFATSDIANAISNGTDFAASTAAAMPTTTEASEESLRELQDVIHTPEHQMEMDMVEDVRKKGIESEERSHQVASRFSIFALFPVVIGSIVTIVFSSMLIHGVRKVCV